MVRASIAQRVAAALRAPLGLALDWLYPRHCCHCEELIDAAAGRILCRRCFDDLLERRIGGSVCRICGLPLAGATEPEVLCLACTAEERSFDRARAFFAYAGPVVSIIRQFKFHGEFFLGPRFLRGALGQGWMPPDLDDADVIVPIALHPRRRRERGYDQALLLARVLAGHLGIGLGARALRRTRYTSQQALLPAGKRAENVRGAFAANEPKSVAGRSVLLVDDVVTTGATAGECSRVLKRAGAAQVQVLALARTVP
jgi:ComF family protein